MENIKVNLVIKSPYVEMSRKGDLIDLNFCGLNTFDGLLLSGDKISYSQGAIFKVRLGFAMELPKGKMAKVYPRSGTRKNFGVILTNSVGNIDNDYNGNEDEWMAEFYAVEDGSMKLGDRILQFEIVDIMPKVEFNVVESFDNENRGGYGSSGI